MVKEKKVCTACTAEKVADEFYVIRDKGGREYLSAACKVCTGERRDAWREANRARHNANARRYRAENVAHLSGFRNGPEGTLRRSHLKRKFGITPEQYLEMQVAQGGGCAICRRPERSTFRGVVRMLAVDHDAHTGRIRGLLCFDCNTAIGKLDHDPARLVAALEYLS